MPALKLRRGEVVRIRGERWRIVGQAGYGAVAIVDAAGCDTRNRRTHARFLLPFELVDRLGASAAPRVVRPARWRRLARAALADAQPTWSSLRAAARAHLTIIPFQLEPALAMLRGDACRFLIADAVGLGKTVQAGLMLAETLQRRPDATAIVISPAGLREQWRDELRNRFGLNVDIMDAAGLARAAGQLPADVNPWAMPKIVITSIDYIKRPEVLRSLEALTWDVAIFDEAHNLAGQSDRASTAAMLAGRARVLILLTATPHSGDDDGFAHLCELGSLNGTEHLAVFRRTHAASPSTRRALLLHVRPTPAERAMHDACIAYASLMWNPPTGAPLPAARLLASVLARRASSSAESLARSIERRLLLLTDASTSHDVQQTLPFRDALAGDDEPDALLGVRGLPDSADERRRLEGLLRLARAAALGESKIATIRRLLSRTAESAIVFTEYRDTLQHLASTLGDVSMAQLHGGLTARERADAIGRFTSGAVRLLLATDAGSEGLNLHHRCRLVINLELPWTPLRLEQRAGRVDRIGQTRRVHVVHLVAADTCEESTLARLVRRIQRMRDTMDLVSHFPDERRIADSVFAQSPQPDLAGRPPALPSGVVTLDLRRDADVEARRIEQARAWCTATRGEADVDGRPVMTRLRTRRRTAQPQCLWLFRLGVTSSSGQLVWEPLVSLQASLNDVPVDRSAALTRLVLRDPPALQELLSRIRDETVTACQPSHRRALQRWSGRERNLMDGLRRRHARLSAALVQRALFDRRDERIAASQTALLDQVLSQSKDRLADLGGCEDLRVDACDLVFAVILE